MGLVRKCFYYKSHDHFLGILLLFSFPVFDVNSQESFSANLGVEFYLLGIAHGT